MNVHNIILMYRLRVHPMLQTAGFQTTSEPAAAKDAAAAAASSAAQHA